MSSQKHWLYRPENLRKLWLWGIGVLAASVLAQAVFDISGHFGFDGWFGFNAIYGFLACMAMVLFARLLGVFVKRAETYYEDQAGGGGPAQ